MITCAACAGESLDGASFCQHCGARLTAATARAPAEAPDEGSREPASDPWAPVTTGALAPEPETPRRKPPVAVVVIAVVLVVALIGGGIAAILSAGGDRDYPAAVRKNFLDACSAQGGMELCTCVLEEIEERYTLTEFTRLEARMTTEADLPDELLQLAVGCAEDMPSAVGGSHRVGPFAL